MKLFKHRIPLFECNVSLYCKFRTSQLYIIRAMEKNYNFAPAFYN